jgi:hypothetical protein
MAQEKEKPLNAAQQTKDIISQPREFLQRLKNIADDGVFIISSFALTGETVDHGDWIEAKAKASGARIYDDSDAIATDANVYYTVNPRTRFNGRGQGDKSDIAQVIAFFADIDVGRIGHKKASTYDTNAEALQALDAFPLEPSITVDTGHGVQALWLFKEAVELSESFTVTEYEAINRGIQALIGADTTADISRIFRLPGSLNVKVAGVPKPVTVIRDTGAEYVIGDFDFVERVYSASAASSSAPAPVEFAHKKVDRRGITGALKTLIDTGRDPEHPERTDRSALVHSAVYKMALKGFSDDEIYSVLTDPKNAISEKVLEHDTEKERMRYVSLSITKARETIKEDAIEKEKAIGEMNILGHTADLDVVIHFRGSIITLPPDKLTGRVIKMLTGLAVGDDAAGYVNYLLTQARERGKVNLAERIARGIHSGDDVFIVNGDSVTRATDGKIVTEQKITEAGKIIAHDEPWLDAEAFGEGYERTTLETAYQEIHAIVSLFRWKEQWQADYLTAFLMIAPFQTLMAWRPWLYILGARATGKTTFFDEVIRGLYPELTVRLDKTTAYACAQTLSGTGSIPVLDEFEKYRHLHDVMEALKIASRGGFFTRGTIGEKAKRFRLNHMPFLGSIYMAGNDAAQFSRMIVFELLPHNGAGLNTLPSPAERERIGARSIGATYREWNEIERIAKEYTQHPRDHFGDGVDTRQVDNFAYARAILSIVKDQASDDFSFVTLPGQACEEITDDGMAILYSVLATRITVENTNAHGSITRKEMALSSAIAKGRTDATQNYGVSVIERGEAKTKYFALNVPAVERELLRGSEYDKLKVLEPLSRIPGAIKTYDVKMNHVSRKCLLIPVSAVKIDEDDDDDE